MTICRRSAVLSMLVLSCARCARQALAFSTAPQHSRHLSHKTTQSYAASINKGKEWPRTQQRGFVKPSRVVAHASSGDPYYITTPIYYVNDKPHIGHAYTTLACDVIARFMRLEGREVMFLTGTDEHGQKVQDSAAKQGKTPLEFCDEVSQSFLRLLDVMHFSHDRFIRTTEAQHAAAVQSLWRKLEENGHIYLGVYAGWYSVRDEAFYSESELVDGKAPTGADVQWVEKEPSYFFRLSAFEKPLLELYEQKPGFIAPDSRRNEVTSFVSSGLKDLSISRTSFDWGVPVPNDPSHVMYVWVDALANYISALGYPDISPGSNFSKFWPADVHMVGKDILRFHAVYWPALLMAAGLEVPERLFAHGWWTRDGAKISKSVGNVVDPFELVARYGVDATRYFLMAEVPFGGDGDYSDASLIAKVNSNLSNELGNLIQRTLSLVVRNCDGVVPTPHESPAVPEDDALLAAAEVALEASREHIATQRLDLYCKAALTLVQECNKYIDEQAPWRIRKTGPEGEARAQRVLWVLTETIRRCAILYQPLLPIGAGKMLDQLKVTRDEPKARAFKAMLDSSFFMVPGTPMDLPTPIFPRIEVEGVDKKPSSQAKGGGKKAKGGNTSKVPQ